MLYVSIFFFAYLTGQHKVIIFTLSNI